MRSRRDDSLGTSSVGAGWRAEASKISPHFGHSAASALTVAPQLGHSYSSDAMEGPGIAMKRGGYNRFYPGPLRAFPGCGGPREAVSRRRASAGGPTGGERARPTPATPRAGAGPG